MQPASVIPASSRRQAMDFSLVLLSQGIECIIAPGTNGHPWELHVESPDFERAVAALQQYRAENHRRFWQQPLPGTGMLFDWTSLIWMILLAVVYTLQATRLPLLRDAGVLDGNAVRHGEWWRLFTAIMLHADLPHLLANLTIGFLLLGLAMGVFGAGHALLAAYLSGALGNLLTLLIDPAHRNLGASGMVMGALGLLTAQSFALIREGFQFSRALVRAVIGGMLLLILLGFSPGSDVPAHIAGFIAGGICGLVLIWLPDRRLHQPASNRLAEAVCAVMVGLPWWLALRQG